MQKKKPLGSNREASLGIVYAGYLLEGIDGLDAAVKLAVVKIFGVKFVCVRSFGRCKHHRIVKLDVVAVLDFKPTPWHHPVWIDSR